MLAFAKVALFSLYSGHGPSFGLRCRIDRSQVYCCSEPRGRVLRNQMSATTPDISLFGTTYLSLHNWVIYWLRNGHCTSEYLLSFACTAIFDDSMQIFMGASFPGAMLPSLSLLMFPYFLVSYSAFYILLKTIQIAWPFGHVFQLFLYVFLLVITIYHEYVIIFRTFLITRHLLKTFDSSNRVTMMPSPFFQFLGGDVWPAWLYH